MTVWVTAIHKIQYLMAPVYSSTGNSACHIHSVLQCIGFPSRILLAFLYGQEPRYVEDCLR